jgi:hypothetical protein
MQPLINFFWNTESIMSESDKIAFLQFLVFFVQAIVLAVYAIDTRGLRKIAQEQANLLKKQLDAVIEQNKVLATDLNRKMASEDREATPFIYWRDGTFYNGSPDSRSVNFENLGGEILIVEMACITPQFSLSPTNLIQSGDIYRMSFDLPHEVQIDFGFKYLNKFKEVKTMTWGINPKDTKPYYMGREYESLPSKRSHLSNDEKKQLGI